MKESSVSKGFMQPVQSKPLTSPQEEKPRDRHGSFAVTGRELQLEHIPVSTSGGHSKPHTWQNTSGREVDFDVVADVDVGVELGENQVGISNTIGSNAESSFLKFGRRWSKNANSLFMFVLVLSVAGIEVAFFKQAKEHRGLLAWAAERTGRQGGLEVHTSVENGGKPAADQKIENLNPNSYSDLKVEGERRVCNISVRLDDILASTSTPDRTVIVTAFTKPFAPMLDLFLERLLKNSSTAALLPHVLVLNFDREGHEYCCARGMKCYYDSQDDVASRTDYGSGEQKWMTPTYLQMMWRRLGLLRSIVQSNYNVLFTDVDIMWLKDPFQELHTSDADMQFASDWHPDVQDEFQVNAGFFFARATPRTIAFFDYWFKDHEIRFPGTNEQDVFMRLRPKRDNFTANEIGIRIRYVPTQIFSGFCEMPRHMDQLVTVHANCCFGLDTKLRVLRKILDDYDWRMSLPVDLSNSLDFHDFKWTPQLC